ncbi:MFS transporter [Acrocarpospora sp. B8E8]|uniref:MFS transporter n=1 Tax=Acrocarpospora sp. B8E8 TaxID=3153572 RepID=UPI00325F881E
MLYSLTVQPSLLADPGARNNIAEAQVVGDGVVTGGQRVWSAWVLFTNRDFRRSWTGSALSMLGTRTLTVTYPLLSYALTGTSAWMGWVVFAATAPALLTYLPAGMLIDRLSPQRVMAWSEAGRGLLLASLCVAMVLGQPHISLLLAVAFVEGGLAVLSSVAETALIPATARKGETDTALAVHEATVHTLALAGRPLGGVLYGLGMLTSFLTNAFCFLLAAAALFRVPAGEPPDRTLRQPFVREIRTGVEEVLKHRFLFSATLLTAHINLVMQSLTVVFIAHMSTTGLSPAVMGMYLAASGIGGIMGALISPKRRDISNKIQETIDRNWIAALAEWVGLTQSGRSTLLVQIWLCSAGLTLILFADLTPWAFGLALLLNGMGGALSNVTIRTEFNSIPADRTARVVSISRLVAYGSIALGPVVATLLYESAGPHATVMILALLMVASALAMTFTPSWRRCLSPNWQPVEP